MRLRVYIILLSILIVFSCAVDKPIKTTNISKPEPTDNFYLPGIDSSVVRNAVQFSDRIDVDFDNRKKANVLYESGKSSFQVADSLWACIQKGQGKDSIVIQAYKNWRNRHDNELNNSRSMDAIKLGKLDRIYLTVLDSAYTEVFKAKSFNPFDLDIRSLLINIYLKQGEITQYPIFYTRAIDELNNFLLVDKSNPYIYEKLGECYYALGGWDKSYRFFHEAEKILKIVSIYKHETEQNNSIPVDTARWIYYLRRQGEAKAKLYDSDSAIYYLNEAKELSDSEPTKQQLQNILNWINWDGGNIRAAEIRDNILKIEDNHDYKKARAEYLKLLPILRTQNARNEINWKIASIEYNLLDRKKDALKRLFLVIQSITASDQSYKLHIIFLKDYAAMCYSVGMEHLSKNRFRLAYIYFNQASQIDWEHKGECFFQLAVLSRENPTEAVRNCTKALNYSEQLSENKIKQIYEMLAISYKRKGEFDMAHIYFQNLINQNNSTQN